MTALSEPAQSWLTSGAAQLLVQCKLHSQLLMELQFAASAGSNVCVPIEVQLSRTCMLALATVDLTMNNIYTFPPMYLQTFGPMFMVHVLTLAVS